jgi:hypothetical protein
VRDERARSCVADGGGVGVSAICDAAIWSCRSAAIDGALYGINGGGCEATSCSTDGAATSATCGDAGRDSASASARVCSESAFVPIEVGNTPCALGAMRLAGENEDARCVAALVDGVVAFADCATGEGAEFAVAFLAFALAVLFAGSVLFDVIGAGEGEVDATWATGGRLAGDATGFGGFAFGSGFVSTGSLCVAGGDGLSEIGEAACGSAVSVLAGSASAAAVDGAAEETAAAWATCARSVAATAGSVTDFGVSDDAAVDTVCGRIAAIHVCARSTTARETSWNDTGAARANSATTTSTPAASAACDTPL